MKSMRDKAILLATMLIMVAFSGFGQRAEVSVCGVRMGTPKATALSILRERFGYAAVSEEGGNIEVANGMIGNIHHDYMTFYFTWTGDESVFNGACLSTPFEISQKKDAIKQREFIKSIYERKYEIKETTNQDGFKTYMFGDSEYLYGAITIDKGRGVDGKIRYYTQVYYFGPYDELDEI